MSRKARFVEALHGRPDPAPDRTTTERNRRQRHGKIDRVKDDAIRTLLDGLEVDSIRELKRLVDLGRYYEDAHVAGFGLVAQIDGAVLGRCPHGVDLDRDFCPRGCRV